MYNRRIQEQEEKTKEIMDISKQLEQEESALINRLNNTMQREQGAMANLMKLNQQSPV
jgi:hypothetical protein